MLKKWANSLQQNSLVKNTLWMLLAQGLRVVLQAIYFIVIARALGAEQYGAFVAAAAFVGIVAPFANLGSGNILIKNVSRNRSLFNIYWGNSLFVTTIVSFVLLGLVQASYHLFIPTNISSNLICSIAISELIFARILDNAGQAFQSVQWLSKTAQLNILPNLIKTVVALVFINILPNSGAKEWGFFYLSSTAISAIIGILLVHKFFGLPKLDLGRIKADILEGFYFSISLSAQNIYNDIDKTMLSRLSSLSSAGIYASAYRIIDVAFVPVRSLLYAAYAKFFQQGSTGIKGSIILAKNLAPIAGIYGAIAGVTLFFLAPVVPYVLGNEYAPTVEALRWLSPLPLLKAMHYFAADTLTGAGFQGLRSAVQVMIAVFNVLINLWLIPLYSWKGTAWSSLASDGLLTASLWLLVAFLNKRQAQVWS